MTFLQRSELYLDHLQYLSCIVKLGGTFMPVDRSIKQIREARNQFLDDSIGSPCALFENDVFLLKLVDLSLVVMLIFLLHHLLLFVHVIVLIEQALCLIVDEVAEHLK